MKKVFFIIAVLIWFTASFFSLSAQQLDFDQIQAEEEFRWGVIACNRGRYNEAISAFLRSLSFKPQNDKTIEWLGRAYFYSGFEEAALELWRDLAERGAAGDVLENKLELIEARRSIFNELDSETRYVLMNELNGTVNNSVRFKRPSSVRPDGKGSYFLVSYATNVIHQINVNGVITKTLRGGLEGFNHPFDIAETEEGEFFVSEFRGDRISKCDRNGNKIMSFGGTGIDTGGLLGPQFLALDGKGYLYVTDYGNQRVAKFDTEGNFVLSFGEADAYYRGLSSPSGIVLMSGYVFVSDSMHKHIAVFDENGNFIRTIADEGLSRPEGLSVYREGVLLIADRERVMTLDIETELLRRLSDFEGAASNVIMAAVNTNNDIVAVDFDRDKVHVLTELNDLISGYDVQLRHIFADDYPRITLDFTVRDREGRPVAGLNESNLLVTENYYPVEETELLFSGYLDETVDIVLLAGRSPTLLSEIQDLSKAGGDLARALTAGDSLRVVSAGSSPVLEAGPGSSPAAAAAAAANGGGPGAFTTGWSLDLGLRFAASELIPGSGKRAVVYVGNDQLPDHAFEDYELVEIGRYFANNGIRFYALYTGQDQDSEQLQYLADISGGGSFYLFNPAGLAPLVDNLRSKINGDYQIRFQAVTDSDFGRRFIPLELEVFIVRKTGRGESGYFAPLEF